MTRHQDLLLRNHAMPRFNCATHFSREFEICRAILRSRRGWICCLLPAGRVCCKSVEMEMERRNARWRVYKELHGFSISNCKIEQYLTTDIYTIHLSSLGSSHHIHTFFYLQSFHNWSLPFTSWGSSNRLLLQRSLLPSKQHQPVGSPILISSSMPWL